MKINSEGVPYYAAIDIGSNAVRLLIKSRECGRFKKETMLRVPLRLGFDVFATGEISEKKADKLKRLMKVFRHLMKIYEVDAYRACATAAMRDASNGAQLIEKIEKSTNIKIEIIGGQEEAQILYDANIHCLEVNDGNYMFVDVGGGSTEVNLMAGGRLAYSKSYDIGTIRILGGGIDKRAWDQLEKELSEVTRGLGKVNIIGSGGNINKLYRMSGDSRDQRITVASVERLYKKLKPLTPLERREKYELKEDRADVIVPASEIFLTIARTIKAEYVYVPSSGLSDGIIESLYIKHKAQQQMIAKAQAAKEGEPVGQEAQAELAVLSSADL